MAFSSTFLPPLSAGKSQLVSYGQPTASLSYMPRVDDKDSLLELRIGIQESAIKNVLEKMSTIKSEMLEQLRETRKLEQNFTTQHRLLEEELKHVNENLNRIGQGTRDFEQNVRDKWMTVNSANTNLRNLENHHVTSLSDVRSRITRCDNAIGKLVEQLGSEVEARRMLTELHNKDAHELHSQLRLLDQKLQSYVDAYQSERELSKFHDLVGTVDRRNTDLIPVLQHTEDVTHKRVGDVEKRLTMEIFEMRRELQATHNQCADEQRRLETRLQESAITTLKSFEARLENVEDELKEEKPDEALYSRVDSLEDDLNEFKQQVLKTFKELESRVNKLSDDLFAEQREGLDRLRTELREGFHTVQESMTSMKAMMEDKLRLSEDTLRQELSQLRKLVVLL